jgi:hypothetical protein
MTPAICRPVRWWIVRQRRLSIIAILPPADEGDTDGTPGTVSKGKIPRSGGQLSPSNEHAPAIDLECWIIVRAPSSFARGRKMPLLEC